MLQFAAGADRETVRREYLLSNTERAALITKSYDQVKRTSGVVAADIDRALKSVEASYLDAGLAKAEQRYGSVDGYLSEGLGLRQKTLDALRAKLRVGP
jgi:protein-tyrosine phosphatase